MASFCGQRPSNVATCIHVVACSATAMTRSSFNALRGRHAVASTLLSAVLGTFLLTFHLRALRQIAITVSKHSNEQVRFAAIAKSALCA